MIAKREWTQSNAKQNKDKHRTPSNNGKYIKCKSRYDTFQYVNNKGTDQTAPMRSLVCAIVVSEMFSRVEAQSYFSVYYVREY